MRSADEDDIFDDEKDITEYADDDNDDGRDEDVDLDVLPTLLAYRDGILEHTWVRVDWEAGKAGIVELLNKCVYLLPKLLLASILVIPVHIS